VLRWDDWFGERVVTPGQRTVLLGLLGGLGLVLALGCTVIGVGGAAVATRVIESFLFETARS
jgi:hypothetical protein